MKFAELMRDEREAGREEGREEGRKEAFTVIAEVVKRLKSGETPEELRETYDDNVVKLAMELV